MASLYSGRQSVVRHETPSQIARVLARHAPTNLSAMLEPAVGTGLLLDPLISRLQRKATELVCIDTDRKAIDAVRARFGPLLKRRFRPVCANFLKWAEQAQRKSNKQLFDCILMNPPFSGKRIHSVKVEFAADPGLKIVRCVPVEAAFILHAVQMLRQGGRILAILPSSVISSRSGIWLREYLLQVGSLPYIHELPSYTFPSVEARTYLFVFEKKRQRQSLVLYNHDLAKPKRLAIQRKQLKPHYRFDYRFHDALSRLQLFKLGTPDLRWDKVRNLASVHRGSVSSPDGPRKAIHTCDYKRGFWRAEASRNLQKADVPEKGVRAGDLLMRRVGRSCAESVGTFIGCLGIACSDCVIIVRSKSTDRVISLLLGLRIILNSDFGRDLIERGTGASYITEDDLLDLFIPTSFVGVYRKLFSNYQQAVRKHRTREMLSAENHLRSLIERRSRKCDPTI